MFLVKDLPEDLKKLYDSGDLVYNPIGILVSKEGKIYQSVGNFEEIIPKVSASGYLMITEDMIMNPGKVKCVAEYVHRIVCFSFGDKDGKSFEQYSKSSRNVIDHINMNKADPRVSNLQFVSNGINLFRAYYKTRSEACRDRFKEYYNSLDEIDQWILKSEIKLDLEGKY